MAEFEGQEDVEFIEVAAGAPLEEPKEAAEAPQDVITMKLDELEQLKRARSSEETLTAGLKEVVQALKGQQAPLNQGQTVGESEEEFSTRLERQLFEPGSAKKALEEAVARFAGPTFGQYTKALADANKKLLMVDPEKAPYYKKYAEEIEQEARTMVQVQGYAPNTYEGAYERVMSRKQPDLIAERAAILAEQIVEAKLKEFGVDVDKARKGVKPVYTDGAGSPAPAKKQVRITSSEANAIKRLEDSGLSTSDARRMVLGSRVEGNRG